MTTTWTSLTEPTRSVALEVLLHGPLSRAELAARLDLSRGTLTRLTRPLVDDGLLQETDDPHTTAAGRPGRPLSVDASTHHVVGVRLTHLAATAVLADLRATPLAEVTVPLPDLAPSAVVAVVADLVARLRADVPGGGSLSALGLAVGGRCDRGRTVVSAPFLGWEQVPVADLVQAATGVASWVESDVVALTTAEHWFGAGRGRDALAVVTVGTGVGCGLVLGDQVVNRPVGGVGLVGHLPLLAGGPLCDRGHRGCAASLLTTRSLRAQASAALDRPVDPADLPDLVRAGDDPALVRLAEDYADALARLVSTVAAVTQVPLVVVAGEGVALADVVEDRLRAGVRAGREPAAEPLELVLEHAGTTQWARGAAAVAVQRYVSPSSAHGDHRR